MPRKTEASYVRRQQGVWSKRFKLPDGRSEVLQVSIRNLARGWKREWQGMTFNLEPQEISSHTKEGSTEAANRWVEYVEAVITGKSGRAISKIDELQNRIAELEREIEAMGDPIITEQNQAEISDTQNEIRMRQYADQQGIDFDATHRSRMEALELLGGNIGESFDAQRGLLLADLDHSPQPENKLLKFWRDQFLALKRAEIATGKRSIGRYDNLQREVKRFVSFVGENATVEAITEATWQAWYLHVIANNAASTQRDYISSSKGFVTHLYEQRQIELPRNLGSLGVTDDDNVIEHYTVDELKAILSDAPGILNCFIHLMANCGFTQVDIASLTPKMLTEKPGYIKRQRSKKVKGKKIPMVEWVLWDTTKELIEQYRTDRHGLVFTQPDGKPWKVEKLKEDGRVSKNDAIATLWKPYKKNNNIRLDMEAIRKTSANLLTSADGDISNRLSIQTKFLGQVPDKGTASKWYVEPPQAELDAAVMRLRSLLIDSA